MKVQQEQIGRLPDLGRLVQQLNDEPEALMARAFPEEKRAAEPRGTRGFAAPLEAFEPPEEEPLVADERRRMLEVGTRAVTKLHNEGEDADLEPMEAVALEAIIQMTGRPAIFIQNGHFFPPPTEWEILEDVRDEIEAACLSVGRIEVTGHPSLDWVGTGFLVARDVVMTNRHVAEVFCQMGYRRRWKFKSGMAANIDYAEELGALDSAEFDLRSVIGVHDEFDMALFRVKRTSSTGATPPEPLVIASQSPSDAAGRNVYTVGYPAWDGRRNDPDVMNRIFTNVFNVKRLQPGAIMEVLEPRSLLRHDCSTLGGNSGSCVVDLETSQVVGLHFGGRFSEGNFAVALWKMTDDPLLKKAKVNFQ